MSRKNVLLNIDPDIDKLAHDRLLSGKQLFDYSTHRLRGFIKDRTQARAVLLRAEVLANHLGKRLVLRYLEKRLLARSVEDTPSAKMLFTSDHDSPLIKAPTRIGVRKTKKMPDKLTLEREKPIVLTANQVAQRLGVHVMTVYKWAKIGVLPTIKLGRGNRLRFRERDIESWLNKRTTGKF